MDTFEQIRDAALNLEPALREELIELLDESLNGLRSEIDEMDDAEMEAELNRRAAEAEADPSIMIPLDVFRKKIRERAGLKEGSDG